MFVLDVQHSDSVIYFFLIIFHPGISQAIEYNSQSSTVNPCYLSVLCMFISVNGCGFLHFLLRCN